jgi:hypothetical protein
MQTGIAVGPAGDVWIITGHRQLCRHSQQSSFDPLRRPRHSRLFRIWLALALFLGLFKLPNN